MKIEIRSTVPDLHPRLHRRIAERVRLALCRFSEGLTRVVVQIRDTNGPRGGIDKECLVQLHRDGQPVLVVREQEDEVMRAVRRALQRTRRTVGRRRSRRRSKTARMTGLLGAALLMVGCAGSGLEVGSRSAAMISSDSAPTYRILEHDLARAPSSEQWIEEELHAALQKRGFRATKAKASLIVDYKILVDENESWGEAQAFVAEGGALGGNGIEDGSMNPNPRSEKVLVVTIQDAESLELLWLGWSKADVTSSELPETARAAIVEIMKRLPAS